MRSDNFFKNALFTILIAVILGIAVSGAAASFFIKDEAARLEKETPAYSTDDVYENITYALSEFRNDTKYKGRIEQERIDSAVKRIRSSYPEYFWLNGYCTTISGDETNISFMTLNDYSPAQLKTMYSELISAAENVISNIPAGSDNYDKALFVHDYLVNNTRYASEKASLNENGLWGTAYGCLVDGEAVCQGYAEAYQLILDRLGIECGVCSGYSDRGKHAWNYVKINGEYYWVDVTWDDPEMESEIDFLMHDYFMITDEMLLRTRTINEDNYYVPQCISLSDNYYKRNGSYFSVYDVNSIGAVVSRAADTRCIELMFADKGAFDTAMEKLFTEQEIWDAGVSIEAGQSLSYINDEKMLTIQIRY
ncbi:MAG: hypothetical protein K6A79_09555 [Ruminococcus sp.]|nr:hypothetical protein [Ruminococcus sp.]